MCVWAYIMTKKQKKKKKARKPYISRKNTLKIINFEILVNLDPFIMYQNFYNIFFSKIGALLRILILSF